MYLHLCLRYRRDADGERLQQLMVAHLSQSSNLTHKTVFNDNTKTAWRTIAIRLYAAAIGPAADTRGPRFLMQKN